jgi:hypothetical protein
LLDVRNGTAAEQEGRQKRKRKNDIVYIVLRLNVMVPLEFFSFALYNIKKLIS